MATYEWAKPIEKRFQLVAHTGPMKTYSSTGEPMEAKNCKFVFKDGVIEFADEAQMVIVSAHPKSSAVVLFEFRQKVIAAFTLSSDCGLLVKHLDERGGGIPNSYRSTAVALLILPDDQPFDGYISVNPVKKDHMITSGKVLVNDMENPRMFVPEPLMVMYQHLRNKEKAGAVPLTKYTYADHELTRQMTYPKKNVGNMCRWFDSNEAMRWLGKVKNYTPVEKALQNAFVFGKNDKCVIKYPKQQMEYVTSWCKSLGLKERAQFEEGEEMDQSDAETVSDATNSEDSDEVKK